ncbi:MAG TPA: hypothetical protein VFX20_13085 [Steroidobacteraceae bacterium]|nr:hypothetical protein [Steroidobacteraceae bacterium]
MPRIVRVAAKIAGATAGLVLVLLLVWIGINLFDQPLSASARAILATPPDPYPAADNVYVALVGFDAPAGQSIVTVGQERIDEHNRALARSLEEGHRGWVIGPPPRARKLEFKGQVDTGSLLISSMWGGATDQRAQISALIDANRELYQRYLSLRGMHGYFVSAGPADSAAGFLAATSLHSLFLASTANGIQAGTPAQRQAAMSDLGQDMHLWETVLDGTGGMLAKVVAAQALHADLLLAGEMVTDPTCDLTFLRGRGDSLLAPFSLQDWKIGNAYEVEMRWEMPAMAAFSRGASHAPWPQRAGTWLGRRFFKLHATENLEAQRTQRLRALADDDPTTYVARRKEYDTWVRDNVSSGGFYNPVGKILLALSTINESFPAQVYDVAAFQRLVYLAYQMRVNRVPLADVAKFMAQHPQWSTHPIGGTPFRWDPASARLAISPAGHEPPGRIFALTLHEWPTQPRP